MNLLWTSYHIYYHSNQDVLLRECLFPLLEYLEELIFIDGFFFLRYWEGGPHIRLRVRCFEEKAKEVSILIKNIVKTYLSSHPSNPEITPDLYLKMANIFNKNGKNVGQKIAEILPNNSIKLQYYTPEFKKYGGKLGVNLSELVFNASSRIIAHLLSKKVIHKEARLGNAFLMMCVGIKAFKLTKKEIISFFDIYYRYWFQYTNHGDNKIIEWENRYLVLRERLINIAKINIDCKIIKDKILNDWLKILTEVNHDIFLNYNEIKKQIVLPSHFLSADPMYYLLMNYFHTHNNRYGILLFEESFLGYIGMKTFLDLKETE